MYLLTHSHTLLITCTCCVDLTKGAQDKDFSYSFSILSPVEPSGSSPTVTRKLEIHTYGPCMERSTLRLPLPFWVNYNPMVWSWTDPLLWFDTPLVPTPDGGGWRNWYPLAWAWDDGRVLRWAIIFWGLNLRLGHHEDQHIFWYLWSDWLPWSSRYLMWVIWIGPIEVNTLRCSPLWGTGGPSIRGRLMGVD